MLLLLLVFALKLKFNQCKDIKQQSYGQIEYKVLAKPKHLLATEYGKHYTWRKEISHDGEVKPTNCL